MATGEPIYFIKMYTTIHMNDDIYDIGLDGLGAYVLLATWAKQNGHRGEFHFKDMTSLQSIMKVKSTRKMKRILHALCMSKWLQIDMQNNMLSCSKWWKYQENPIGKSSENNPNRDKRAREIKEQEKNSPPTPPRASAESEILKSDKFEQFWEAYPPCKQGRKNKKETAGEWNARIRDGVDPDEMILAASNFARSRSGEDIQYTMSPARFIGPSAAYDGFLGHVSVDPLAGQPAKTRRNLAAMERAIEATRREEEKNDGNNSQF